MGVFLTSGRLLWVLLSTSSGFDVELRPTLARAVALHLLHLRECMHRDHLWRA